MAHIDDLIQKYSVGLPWPPIHRILDEEPHGTGAVVLLTGSTGSLGAEILALLLNDENIEKIYAFNRSSREPTLARQQSKFIAQGLDSKLLQFNKLAFIEGDTTLPTLGLDEELYKELQSTVTLIIHNAWPIHLDRPLAYFEPNICGTRNLIDMAISSTRSLSTRFLFISSVAAAQSWDPSDGLVPEDVLTNSGVAVGWGYGESKFVTERIVSRSGLRATTLRISQICGRLENGAWSPDEWLPRLVKSGFVLGALPNAAGLVSWVPLDVVAKCTLEVAFSTEQPPPLLNLWNSRPVQWGVLMDAMGQALMRRAGRAMPLVNIPDWVRMLNQHTRNASTEELSRIPASKLPLHVMAMADTAVRQSSRTDVQHLTVPTLDNRKAHIFSPTLRGLPAIGAAEAEKWVEYWCRTGFIETTTRARL